MAPYVGKVNLRKSLKKIDSKISIDYKYYSSIKCAFYKLNLLIKVLRWNNEIFVNNDNHIARS